VSTSGVSRQTDHDPIPNGAIVATAGVGKAGSPRQVGMTTNGRIWYMNTEAERLAIRALS